MSRKIAVYFIPEPLLNKFGRMEKSKGNSLLKKLSKLSFLLHLAYINEIQLTRKHQVDASLI